MNVQNAISYTVQNADLNIVIYAEPNTERTRMTLTVAKAQNSELCEICRRNVAYFNCSRCSRAVCGYCMINGLCVNCWSKEGVKKL
jgi:hypothetical protein